MTIPPEAVTIISVCGMIISMFFAFKKNRKADNEEIKNQEKFNTQIEMKIDRIADDLKEIKIQGKDNNREITEIRVDLEVVKRDLKTAFSMIEDIKVATK